MRPPRLEDLPYLLRKKGRYTGSNMVGYTANHDAAEVRSVMSRLDEYISAKDFGAVGNGYENDSQAIQDAVYASVQEGVTCYIPGGTYLIPTPIKIPDNCRIIGDGYHTHLKNDITAPLNIFTSADKYDNLMSNVAIGRMRLNGQRKDRKIVIPGTRTRSHALMDLGQSPANEPGYGTNLWLFELHLEESIHFHLSVEGVEGIHIWGIYVYGDGFDADGANYIGNTDGIHLVNCKDISIHDCNIETGDDCIGLTNDVNGILRCNISNIACTSGYGNGVACVADATGTSGDVCDVNINNIAYTVSRDSADDTGSAVRIRKTGTGTGTVHNINVSNVETRGSATAGALHALEIMGRVDTEEVHDITCTNIQAENTRGTAVYCLYADDLLLQNIRTNTCGRGTGTFNGIQIEACNRVVLDNAVCRGDDTCGVLVKDSSCVRMDNVLVASSKNTGIKIDTSTWVSLGPGCWVTDWGAKVTNYGLVTTGTCSGVIYGKYTNYTCDPITVGILNIDNAGKLDFYSGHPLIWARFTDDGAAVTLSDNEGVASITRTAQGDYTFVYDTNLTLYVPGNVGSYLVTGSANTGVNNADVICKPITHSAGSVRIKYTDGAGALAATTEGFMQIFAMIDTA